MGFIHSILENEFDIATATITDVGYLGLFPKSILKMLHQYAREIGRFNQDKGEFMTLIDKLLTAFIYRPITIQKMIQLMITKKKKSICLENNDSKRTYLPPHNNSEYT